MSFNIPEFTVTEFSRSIKRVVEDAFGYVKIKGEVTGFKRASSGHIYFSLKDDDATLSAVCFRNAASLIDFEMADGLQITASGRVTTFEGRSNYQIIVEKLEISGIGAILEMLEKRRQKLALEGLFDAVHKKPLPYFPKIIGVITSETGAVIEDIKHRIEARCPTHIKLYPTLVQGPKAALEIINAIKFFNKLKDAERPEVLIIARGGGSFEDLLPFYDEALIRAVFDSKIPIISAVGHETDTTLIDFVSDVRAPTPTAAAEFATLVISDLKMRLNFLQEKLKFLPQNFLAEKSNQIKNLQRYIVDPAQMLNQINEKFLFLEKRFFNVAKNFIEKKSQELSAIKISNQRISDQINIAEQKIERAVKSLKLGVNDRLKSINISLQNLNKLLINNNYREVLKRGFTLIKNEKNHIVSSIAEIKVKEKISVEMFDGKFDTYVLSLDNKDFKVEEKNPNQEDIFQPKLI